MFLLTLRAELLFERIMRDIQRVSAVNGILLCLKQLSIFRPQREPRLNLRLDISCPCEFDGRRIGANDSGSGRTCFRCLVFVENFLNFSLCVAACAIHILLSVLQRILIESQLRLLQGELVLNIALSSGGCGCQSPRQFGDAIIVGVNGILR